MKAVKTLLVISKFPPEYSGPGVRIPRLYKWFEEKGKAYDLKIICNGVEQVKNENYSYEGWPVRRITAEYLNKLFLALKFIPKRITHSLIYQYEFIKTLLILFLSPAYRDIHLIHLAGHSGGTAATLLWARMRKIPVLMELVTELARPQQKFFFMFKAEIPQKGKVVALTEKAKQACIELGLSEDKIWARPNPINDKIFKPDFDQKYTLREKLTPFGQDKIIISNVAKMMPQKNQYLILKALCHLPDKFCAVIAGPFIQEGPLYARDKKYVEEMKGFIAEHNLQSRVCLVADFVKADEYMKLADIYAMPAWNEGFGTPMMEAMGCGVPVVANAAEGAFQEWIRQGENGYLCDIQKPEEWAQAIEKAALFTEEQCLEISSFIHKKAGQGAIYSQYEDIINTLLR